MVLRLCGARPRPQLLHELLGRRQIRAGYRTSDGYARQQKDGQKSGHYEGAHGKSLSSEISTSLAFALLLHKPSSDPMRHPPERGKKKARRNGRSEERRVGKE